jgi:uncharacterized protein YhdP
MSTRADLRNGKALIHRSVLDAQAVDIALEGEVDLLQKTLDIKGLVAPLKTVTRIIDWVPIIGKPIANTFTTIPIQARGSWEDPKVETAVMSSITGDLVSIIKNMRDKTPDGGG